MSTRRLSGKITRRPGERACVDSPEDIAAMCDAADDELCCVRNLPDAACDYPACEEA